MTTNVVTGKADVFYADLPVAGYATAQTDGELETSKTEAHAFPGKASSSRRAIGR